MERFLDAIKDLGFRFATRAGLTIGLEDVKTPADKPQILEEFEERAAQVETNYRRGVITDDERRQELIEIWTEATGRVKESMELALKAERFNPIDMMVRSGARGNITQVSQIAGMRGLVANPRGDIIPRPIRANFREGLTVLEYFISTHGARKGLADTALRTADSGYLTRRLVDVSQEVIVRAADCGTDRGIVLTVRAKAGDPAIRNLRNRLFGRVLADPVKVERKVVEVPGAGKLDAGVIIGRRQLEAIAAESAITSVRVRSVLTCEERYGICGACYGLSLATGRPVEIGRGGGHRRRPVDRRAGHAADHAYLPHRRRGRRGHHPRPAPRGRAVRSPHPQGQGDHRRTGRHRLPGRAGGEPQAGRHRHATEWSRSTP